MPVRTKDGVVHNVDDHATKQAYGYLRCGRLFARRENKGTWKPAEGRVLRAEYVRTSVTCLFCAADCQSTTNTKRWFVP